MTLGAFDATAGALQLVVPSYGLRLVRRFGVHRVGWFLVTAFASMAALHLLAPPTGSGLSPDMTLNIVYAIGSVLLLVGMGHMETFFKQHDRLQTTERSLNSQWDAHVKNETASLARANEALQHEISRRDHAEKSLRDSESQYRFLFTENPQPMWVFDLTEYRFLAVNKAALLQYGFSPEEFMRLTPQDLLPPEQVEAFISEVAKPCTRPERARWQHYRRDQMLIDVEVSARDLNYGGVPARLVAINDVSAQHQRDYETFREQKMELVSRVAGGVATRFNDVLSVIENHASILRQKTQDPEISEQLQEIEVTAARGATLGYQMLAISGRQLLQPRPLDLNKLIQNLGLILRRVVGEKVIFQNLCGKGTLPVMADPKVLEQVMMTLVKNARDAMPDQGTVSVTTGAVRISEPPIRQNPESATSEFARISVRDTGAGISPEDQARLFEPFFTTKAADKGQGLGLASVLGAVRQHGGWIECTSASGAGTEFRIFLPCVDAKLLPAAGQQSGTLDRGTVLLVDPDDRARGVARYVLNRHGYRVIEADSQSIALMLWEKQAQNIDLLVTDLTLPGASGFDLANQLQQTRASLKVIFACASEAEAANQAAAAPEGAQFVSKPYNSEKLMESVEACMPSEQV